MNQYPLVYLDHVHKNYGDAPALYDVSLNIQPGRIIGLLGPNGSGKTTIIKLINGLLQPTSGHIYLKGVKPSPDTKRIVSYLPDTTYLSDSSKVIEAVKYFQDFYDNFDSAKAMQLLKDLHIDPQARIGSLSKGNKEKMQLILVMSRHAELYILDEPIGGVDPAAPQSSVIISTHLIADIEPILDEVILINQGQIFLHENANQLRQQYNQSIDNLFRSQFRFY